MAGSVNSRQQALEASERSMRAKVENTPNVAIQWYEAQGRITMWNHASQTLYGIEGKQAKGKTLDQLVHTPDQAAASGSTSSTISSKDCWVEVSWSSQPWGKERVL